MGLFSWKTADTEESISCDGSVRGALPVKMLIPPFKLAELPTVVTEKFDADGVLIEENYEGYGVFGGMDFYEVTAYLNGIASGDTDTDRIAAIDLISKHTDGYGGMCNIQAANNGGVITPRLVSMSSRDDASWAHYPPNEDCEYQGFFYGEEDGEW